MKHAYDNLNKLAGCSAFSRKKIQKIPKKFQKIPKKSFQKKLQKKIPTRLKILPVKH
jgi:hypothetical protein